MTRITCQVIPTGDGITFLWSEDAVSFEPYTLQADKAAQFQAAARAAWEQLWASSAANADTFRATFALAQAGHELYQAIFDGDTGREVAHWLGGRRQQGPVELDIVSTSLTAVPWNVVYDSASSFGGTDSRRAFWGCQFALTVSRRVNALRQANLLFQPRVLLAIDSTLRTALPEAEGKRLDAFIASKCLSVVESKSALSSEIESQAPEVVYLFCRTSDTNLILGEQTISTAELSELLTADENLAPVVILNIASTDGAAQMLEPEFIDQLRLPGLVMPIRPMAPTWANDFGLEVLAGFVYDGQPLAKLLQAHRISNPQTGLGISAFCPPGLRVIWTEDAVQDAPSAPPAGPLPELPYRSLPAHVEKAAQKEKKRRAFAASRVAQFLWIIIPATLLLLVITWAVTRRTPDDRSEAAAPQDKQLEKLIEEGLDNSIKVWDRSVVAEANAIQAHKGGVNALVLLLGDRFAASGGADGIVRFWDLARGGLVHSLPPQEGTVFAVAAGHDDKTQLLATATSTDEGDTKLWEVQAEGAKLTAKELHVLKGHKKAVTSFSFSPDGKSLASASLDGTIIVWDTTTGKESGTMKGSQGPVRSVAFGGDGDLLISGGDDKKIRLWNIKLLSQVGVLSIVMDEQQEVKNVDFPLEGHTGAVTNLIYLPLEIVSASRDGTIKLWTLQSGKDIATIRAPGVQSVALAGKLLISGGADSIVRLWDSVQGHERFSFSDHTGPVRAIAAKRDRTVIISGSADGTIRFWRAAPKASGGAPKKE